MSTSAIWLFLAFLMAALAYMAQLTVGFWAPIALIIVAVVAAVIGLVAEIRSRRRASR